MPAKEFLEQECSNVNDLLEETLRYKYGPRVSEDFFTECQARLNYLTSELKTVSPSDKTALHWLSLQLDQLSDLISRIERSSIENFSWPFADELKRIATDLCRESSLTGTGLSDPIFHVFSGGGLGSYAIYPEEVRVSASKNRILTIVFPRTLKNYVLLHSILGHEIGHAIWRSIRHSSNLPAVMSNCLYKTGNVLLDTANAADWLFGTGAPKHVKNHLKDLRKKFRWLKKDNFFEQYAALPAWREEIFCDFIGLLTFGPSFVAALCELLYALDPSGESINPRHPPVGLRVNLMLQAVNILSYNNASSLPSGDFKDCHISFWSELSTTKKTNQWFDIFTDDQIKCVLEELSKVLDDNKPALFTMAGNQELINLFEMVVEKIPPVGFALDKEGAPDPSSIDFRDTLYVGWLAKHHKNAMPFSTINRLCEYGIMQQLGLDIYYKNP